MTSFAVRTSKMRGGDSRRKGAREISIMPWSNEDESRLPTKRATARASMHAGSVATSSLTSARMTAIVIVIRVTPPNAAAPPTRA